MRVRYTPRAFADLEAIRTYIAQHIPAAAGKVVALIEKIALRLGEFLNSGSDPTNSMRGSSFRLDIRIVSIIGLFLVKS